MKAQRAVDVSLGTSLALVAIPVIVLLAVGSAISLRAWPFFVQRRVGKDGKVFALPKLRTLPTSTPRSANKYELATIRVPRFCGFLRRTHLDELPQLLVVPLGWMSLVGPRPEMPRLLAAYPEAFASERSAVRPGCTGLWQISRAANGLIYESPEYDLAYVRRGGVVLDFWILYRTLATTVSRRREIELVDVPEWAWNDRGAQSAVSTAA